MTRRVRIGPDKNGNFALKVSLPGFDAYEDDDTEPNRFSFSSNWRDIVKPHAVGVVAAGTVGSIATVAFPALLYIPFMEVHGKVGNTFWDDRAPSGGAGKTYDISNTALQLYRASNQWMYVIFKHI